MAQTCGCDAERQYAPTQKTGITLNVEDLSGVVLRRIQNTNRVSSGEYLSAKTSHTSYRTSTLDNGSQPIQKHDSYQRRLARLKGQAGVLTDQKQKTGEPAHTLRFGLFKNCCE